MAEETFALLYHPGWGKFEITGELEQLYLAKRQAAGLPTPNLHSAAIRTDPLLIAAVQELDSSEIGLRVIQVPIEYRHCYKIRDSTGREEIILDPERLVCHELRTLNIMAMTPAEGLTKLRQLRLLLLDFDEASSDEDSDEEDDEEDEETEEE